MQKKKELSLREYMERFSDEEACITCLKNAKWPDGYVCPLSKMRQQRSILSENKKTISVQALQAPDISHREHDHAQESFAADNMVHGILLCCM